MQQQLNLRHEGTHFDLREIFNELNRRIFASVFADTKWSGDAGENIDRENNSFLAQSRKRIG